MTTSNRILRLISKVCELNPNSQELELEASREVREILRKDVSRKCKTKLLYQPLMEALSFQGVGDGVVIRYLEDHGSISYFQVARRIKDQARQAGSLCPKLDGFQNFQGCGYKKTGPSCNNLAMLATCPVGMHDLLKGVLNIKAYSLFFYLRDQCQGDLLTHFDRIIETHRQGAKDDSWVTAAKAELVDDFTQVFGVGDKLANMTLSFLFSADPEDHVHVQVGQAMVAVDSLVHNFLHRTGILKFYQAEHPYGGGCSNQCSRALEAVIRRIDARKFNPSYPEYYPRFVQLSIWKFCSLSGLAICNGVNIKDSKPCDRKDLCPVFGLCDHIPLRPEP